MECKKKNRWADKNGGGDLTSFRRSAAVAAGGTRIATLGVDGDDVRERWIVISSAIVVCAVLRGSV